MTAPIEIVAAEDQHIDPIVHLLGEIQVATYVGVSPEVTPEALQYHVSGDWAANKAASLREKLEQGTPQIWAALCAGSVIGYCALWDDQMGGMLGVDPAWQRSTVGPRLALTALEHCNRGRDIHLTVVPGTPAVSFYRRIGFVPTGHALKQNEIPRLRGGQLLPQIELVIATEKVDAAIVNLQALLAKRSG